MSEKIKLHIWHKIMLGVLLVAILLVVVIYIVAQKFLGKGFQESPVNFNTQKSDPEMEGYKKLP